MILSSFTTLAITLEYPCDWHFWKDYDVKRAEHDGWNYDCGTFDYKFREDPYKNIFSEEILLPDDHEYWDTHDK